MYRDGSDGLGSDRSRRGTGAWSGTRLTPVRGASSGENRESSTRVLRRGRTVYPRPVLSGLPVLTCRRLWTRVSSQSWVSSCVSSRHLPDLLTGPGRRQSPVRSSCSSTERERVSWSQGRRAPGTGPTGPLGSETGEGLGPWDVSVLTETGMPTGDRDQNSRTRTTGSSPSVSPDTPGIWNIYGTWSSLARLGLGEVPPGSWVKRLVLTCYFGCEKQSEVYGRGTRAPTWPEPKGQGKGRRDVPAVFVCQDRSRRKRS